MVQGTRKFVRCREQFEIEKFEIEEGYALFLGKISRDQTFCSRQKDIRDRGQSRQGESTVQNNPDIQSEHISSEMNKPNKAQTEPNIVYHETPLIKLPRALQRLANYNKPDLKDQNIASSIGLLMP